ncbi:recombination protein NinB [Tatumella sp. UCD-D_suzukii]|uniref:recombination protein NinB n=1 Tax=Tatumella sp. UCD-D_suzukii TaxID=1408192 RepID=UPI00056F872D|nr:recombination protein NinB [Tatumella sp. UCD-D_suzukii]
MRLHTTNFQAIGQQLSELLQSGNSFRLKVEPWRERRSLSQNSMQHAWYAEISRYLIRNGRSFASAEWVKDAMKHTYLGYEETERVDVITGERTVIQTLRHTSRLDTGEMHDYLTKVEGWARSIGCLLTAPDNSEYRELQRRQDE